MTSLSQPMALTYKSWEGVVKWVTIAKEREESGEGPIGCLKGTCVFVQLAKEEREEEEPYPTL